MSRNIIFPKIFAPVRGIPKTVYRPIPKVEHFFYSYILIIKSKRCTKFSNLFLE